MKKEVFMITSFVVVLCAASPFLRIPEADRAILSEVAQEYRLKGESKHLLFAIYLAEGNEKDRARGLLDGREMGVLEPAARRYHGNHAQSLRLQAKWAAGTIQKRYTGDLEAFARRWAPVESHPLNRHWRGNVKKILAHNRRSDKGLASHAQNSPK
jgi:hypothetical protein